MEIIFDKAAHQYRVDGRLVPSVTSVLNAAGLTNPRFFTQESRERGTAVHSAIHYLVQGDLDESSLCKEVMRYFKAFVMFQNLTHFTTIFSEYTVYSGDFDYIGTLDLYGWLNGRRVIIDVKTGSVPPTVDLQLWAYRRAAEEMGCKVDGVFSLNLRKDSSFRLKEHFDAHAFVMFLNALNKTRLQTVGAVDEIGAGK